MAQCPYLPCSKEISKLTDEVMADNNGVSTDCPHCNSLLIIKNGELLDFHKYLNSKEPSWPKDGKNTEYIEM